MATVKEILDRANKKTLLLLTLALLAASCSSDNPGPATSTPNSEPPPAQPATVTLRVAIWDNREQNQTAVRTELWVRGDGSWYPDMRFGGDSRNFGPYTVGSSPEMVFYPLGREIPEIPVDVRITSDICPNACDRDIINLELWDDRFEVWGAPVESQVIQRN